MAKPKSSNPRRHLHKTDVRGIVQLVTQATAGVTRIVQGVHRSVYNTVGVSAGSGAAQIRGITGLV